MRFILLFLLSIVLSPLSWSADYQKGWTAFENRDYATALREWMPLAEQGDAGAQFSIGLLYDSGWGVLQDLVYAHMWWNIAASEGNEDGSWNRNSLAKRMTTEQIAEAQKLARECVAKNYKGC